MASTSSMSDDLRDNIKAAILNNLGAQKDAGPKEPPKPDEIAVKSVDENSFVNTMASVEGERILFSELFGITPEQVTKIAQGPDFSVKHFLGYTWDPEVAPFIPEVNPLYSPDIKSAYEILVGWELGDNTMIYGPPGAGKTTLVRHCAALLNMPFIRIVGRGDMETGPILGVPSIIAGTLTWIDGLLTSGARHGAVVLLDEPWLIPSEIMMGVNSLLEDDRTLILSDCPMTSAERVVKVNENLRIAVCDNTGGQGDLSGRHAGVQVQNTATLDRFKTSIHMNYMSQKDETDMLHKLVPEIEKAVLKKMVKFAHLVRTSYNQGEQSITLSPRGLTSWAQKAVFFKDVQRGLEVAYIKKLVEDSEITAARGWFQTVFGDGS